MSPVQRKIWVIIAAVVIIVACAIGVWYSGIFWQSQQPKAPIKIGLVGPFTGPAAETGRDFRFGAEMALEDIRARGGVLGRDVEIIYGDDESKPDVGVSVMERMITLDGVDLVTGCFHSSVALATMDTAAKYKKPYLITIAASTAIGQKILSDPEKYKYIFQCNPNTTGWQMAYIDTIRYVVDSGQWTPKERKLALIVEDTDWGISCANLWVDYFTKWGWNIVTIERVKVGETEFYPILTKIRDLGATLVKSELSSMTSGVALCKQITELGLPVVHVMGTYATGTDFPGLVGSYANYMISEAVPIPRDFHQRIHSKYPEIPPPEQGPMTAWYPTAMYDVLMFIFDTINKAGTLDADKLVEAFEKANYQGVYGRRVFTKSHNVVIGAEYITPSGTQFIDGKFYTIYPPAAAETTFKIPPTIKGS